MRVEGTILGEKVHASGASSLAYLVPLNPKLAEKVTDQSESL